MLSQRSLAVASAALLVFASAASAVAGPSGSDHKIDKAVRDALAAGAPTQSVIITVQPGYRDTIRQALQQHGDVIKSEHPLIDAIAVQLHSSDIAEIANQPWVNTIGADAIVSAKAVATSTTTTSPS